MCELEAALLRLQELAANHPDEIFRMVTRNECWKIEYTYNGVWHSWGHSPGAGTTLPYVINLAVDDAVDKFKAEENVIETT